MIATQPALFRLENPFPFNQDFGFQILDFIPPVPGFNDNQCWRTAGLRNDVGRYRGTIYMSHKVWSCGYGVLIEFENGEVEAFHPFSLFPVIRKG